MVSAKKLLVSGLIFCVGFLFCAKPQAPAMSPPTTASAPTSREGKPSFVRAEDQGEDFSLLESSEVLRRLIKADNRIIRWKATKVIGDRQIAGKLDLSKEELAELEQYIAKQIELIGSAKTGEARSDINSQIARLWRLSANKLIENLGNNNLAIVDAVIENLAMMRNEEIVDQIIARIESSSNPKFKQFAIYAIGMMNSKYSCHIPNRPTMSDEESDALAAKTIIPFLKKLQENEKDPKILTAIKESLEYLDKPLNRQPRQTMPTTTSAPTTMPIN